MNLFNSTFETSLRFLLILSKLNFPATVNALMYYDFMCVYGKEFGIADYNLNGENSFKFGEIGARRKKAKDTIKSLVLNGYVHPECTEKGFVYKISEQGKRKSGGFISDYAKEYALNIDKVLAKYGAVSDETLSRVILTKSTEG